MTVMDERRQKLRAMNEHQFREFVDDQLRAGSVQFKAFQDALAENTALTQTVATSTKEIVEAFNTTKKGLHFFAAVGRGTSRLAKIMIPILTLIGIISALAHGHWPDWSKLGE